jgi:alkaline phosphatase D
MMKFWAVLPRIPHSALRSARVWNRILSLVTVALSLVVVASTMYIINKEDQVEESPTTGGGRVSARLHNATIPQWKPLPDYSQVLTRIAFGSCNSHEMPQPHWDTLTQIYQPDLFILAGDNVYGDCNETTCFHLRETYRQMANHASVQGAAPLLSVYATLDDHDYGLNDCYGTNPYKDLARELFADFFDLPWSEFADKDGVYRSNVWGRNNQRLQVILLDTRYARSPMNRTGNDDVPIAPVLDPTQPPKHPNGTVDKEGAVYGWQMLSKKQWEWLEAQLQKPAELRIMVSSIQVLSTSSNYEAWKQLPLEQDRLFRLIQGKSVVLFSGDIHVGALYEDGNLIEVTSSSLTHTVPIGEEFSDHCATVDECEKPDPRRVGGHFVFDNNFGSMDIDWAKKTFQVALRRTETSKGSSYLLKTPSILYGNAGDVLISKSYSFPF